MQQKDIQLAVSKSGLALFCIEVIFYLYWLATGIYIAVVASTFLLSHIISAISHLAVTIVLCLLMEHYNTFKRIRAARKNISAEQLARVEPIPEMPRHPYLFSWVVPVLVGLGTDVFIMIMTILSGGMGDHVVNIELALASWAVMDTIIFICWSIWVYARMKGLLVKMQTEKGT